MTPKCLAYGVSIPGKSTNLRSGKLKNVIGQVASESELSAAVDPEIGEFEHEWIGQQDESNIRVLRHFEQRYNTMFAVKYAALGNASATSAIIRNVFAARDIGMADLHPTDPKLLPLDEAVEAARAANVEKDIRVRDLSRPRAVHRGHVVPEVLDSPRSYATR